MNRINSQSGDSESAVGVSIDRARSTLDNLGVSFLGGVATAGFMIATTLMSSDHERRLRQEARDYENKRRIEAARYNAKLHRAGEYNSGGDCS